MAGGGFTFTQVGVGPPGPEPGWQDCQAEGAKGRPGWFPATVWGARPAQPSRWLRLGPRWDTLELGKGKLSQASRTFYKSRRETSKGTKAKYTSS